MRKPCDIQRIEIVGTQKEPYQNNLTSLLENLLDPFQRIHHTISRPDFENHTDEITHYSQTQLESTSYLRPHNSHAFYTFYLSFFFLMCLYLYQIEIWGKTVFLISCARDPMRLVVQELVVLVSHSQPATCQASKDIERDNQRKSITS